MGGDKKALTNTWAGNFGEVVRLIIEVPVGPGRTK